MATLREIIYDIKEVLNAYSDDNKTSEEHIAFMVNNKRNLLLKQFMSNLTKEVPREAMQSIVLDLEVDRSCIDKKTILVSTEYLPASIETSGRHALTGVYTVGARFITNINLIDYLRIPYITAGKFKSQMLYVSIDPESKLVVYNTADKHLAMEQIRVEAVFENPEEAYEFTTGSKTCDFYDSKYPIESSMIDIIKSEIIKELSLKLQFPTDDNNDGEDNIKIPNTRWNNTRR